MKNKNKVNQPNLKKNKRKWLILATVFLFVVLLSASLIIGFKEAFAKKVYPGVEIGYLDIGGQTQNQVLSQLKKIEENIQQKGLIFRSQGKEISINPIVVLATDPDLAKQILIFDWPKTVTNAYQVGHSGNWWQNLLAQGQTYFFGKRISVRYELNREEMINNLKANFSQLEKLPLNAQLKIEGDNIEVIKEENGYVFDYKKAVVELINNIDNLNFQPIELKLSYQKPEIKKEDTDLAVKSLEKILTINSLKLVGEDKNWELNKEQFVPWLEFQLVDNQVVIGLNKDKVFEFLKPIENQVNINGQDAKFELKDNRVTEFQASQDGKALNLEKTYQMINDQIRSSESKDIELIIEVSPAKVTTGDLNNLGIKELIGQGVSNFKGSPVNRRHNIGVGAASLNGILIAPNEEFSLLKALGPVDGEHGYKQELVIKGDRTIPEYGGGLCQIGTTTFRAALRSGLPITMRRNHSYRVVYYEPAGMDATIYNPAPDMKFINDTGAYILFTTRISGDNLFFEFYGTKDGRKILIDPDPPTIFNVTSPGEAHYIETTDLKPGEKKKVESAHKGADTYFKYTVTYSNGEIKEQEFKSHYVAWPEVWLVGVTPTATSTDQTISGETPPAEQVVQ